VTGTRTAPIEPIDEAWSVARTEPGAVAAPGDLEALDAKGLAWLNARAPGTVASALRDAGQWDEDAKNRFDASDWWFRARFDAEPARGGESLALAFGGLATVADVWLNGEPLLHSESMFHAHDVDVTSRLRDRNELAIRFASLDAFVAKKKGRPRWRARLVETTQLRWIRTSLLGRMAQSMSGFQIVGPYRPIALERRARATVLACDVRPRCEGADGVVDVRVRLRPHGAPPRAATLRIGAASGPLDVKPDSDALVVSGALRVRDVARWWPFSHGAQPQYAASISLDGAGEPIAIDLGPVAFRELRLRTDGGDFAVVVNGVDVFCRGACWFPPDPLRVAGDAAAITRALDDAKAGGMNMLRIPGVGTYEDVPFFDACDRLGILVWQDMMFANMEYPDDPTFAASVEREARELFDRTQTHASLAVVCGGSETEQQPAMMGIPRPSWTTSIARELLPRVTAEVRPDVAYVRSSPSGAEAGGQMAFDPRAGCSHYYGVGGYMRPLEDARRAGVRFASECLAFGNVPEDSVIDRFMPEGHRAGTHPAWKARVPRDAGGTWDFDDIRDHYLNLLFGVDPQKLRYADVDRYLALSRVVTGELIERTVGEWRRPGSTCHGAIVWTLRDLRLGAGFGIMNADGEPKPVYWACKRAFAPLLLTCTDEGNNGLDFHAVNDGDAPLDAQLHVALYRDDVLVVEGRTPLSAPPRGGASVNLQAAIDRFVDATYAFRFGPPGHDLVVGRLLGADGAVLARTFFSPLGLARPRAADLHLAATVERQGERQGDVVVVTLKTPAFAQFIAVDSPGWRPDDDYFHVEPGGERAITFRALQDEIGKTDKAEKPPPFRAAFAPLNTHAVTRVALT
jgi:beta-mannosidase